jgi:hypothetical protein
MQRFQLYIDGQIAEGSAADVIRAVTSAHTACA